IGFVIHSVDKETFRSRFPGLFWIENYGRLDTFVSMLRRCTKVVSTGLHGAIFAQALGIPAVAVKVGDKILGGDFKFRDYYNWLGDYGYSGRVDLTTAANEQVDWTALTSSAAAPAALSTTQLLATFPFPA